MISITINGGAFHQSLTLQHTPFPQDHTRANPAEWTDPGSQTDYGILSNQGGWMNERFRRHSASSLQALQVKGATEPSSFLAAKIAEATGP